MLKSIKVLMAYLLVGLAVSSCTGGGIEIEVVSATQTVQAVQAAIDLPTPTPATVTSLADAATPTVTATPRATNTPRSTQTPTQTPTQIPSPTPTEASSHHSTPTVTPTRKPVTRIGTGVVLAAEDVPPEFEEIDLAATGLTEEDLVDSPFPVDSVFAFATADMTEAVIGVTARLATFFDRLGFDLAMSGPELIADLVLRNMGDRVVVLEQEPLAIPDIGDNSSGVTALADVEGELIRVDVAIFRKRTTGAFVAVLYPEESERPVAASDLAQTLADKIK